MAPQRKSQRERHGEQTDAEELDAAAAPAEAGAAHIGTGNRPRGHDRRVLLLQASVATSRDSATSVVARSCTSATRMAAAPGLRPEASGRPR